VRRTCEAVHARRKPSEILFCWRITPIHVARHVSNADLESSVWPIARFNGGSIEISRINISKPNFRISVLGTLNLGPVNVGQLQFGPFIGISFAGTALGGLLAWTARNTPR